MAFERLRKFFGPFSSGFNTASIGPKTPVTEASGVGETAVYGGYPISTDRNPEMAQPKRRFRRFNQMIRNVEIIGAAVMMTHRLLAGCEWTFSPPKDLQGASEAEAKQKAELTKQILNDMTTSWPKFVAKHGLFPFFGFSIGEWTAKRRPDGDMGFADVESRGHATINRWNLDDSGTLQGVEQLSPYDNIPHYIARGRMVYSQLDAITDSPDGVGLLRLCAEAVRMLQEYLRIEGSGFSNDLRGVPIAYAPLADLKKKIGTVVNGAIFTQADMDAHLQGLVDYLENHVRSGDLSLMLDSDVYRDKAGNPTGNPKYKVDVQRGDGGPQEEMAAAIERLTAAIARLLGVEHLLIGAGDSGSYALSSEKILMYKLLIDSTLSEMAHTFRRDLLVPLFRDLNAWDERLIPDMKPEVIALRSVEEALDVLTKTAMLRPGDEAGNVLRDRVGLPPAPEDDGFGLLGMPPGWRPGKLPNAGEIESEDGITPPPDPAIGAGAGDDASRAAAADGSKVPAATTTADVKPATGKKKRRPALGRSPSL